MVPIVWRVSTFLATAHGRRGEVAIDRHVTAVTHDDVVHAAVGEDGRHFATEYGTRLCSYRSRDVDALTIESTPLSPATLYAP